jgi:DeoR family transcriptional regulator of aga operon
MSAFNRREKILSLLEIKGFIDVKSLVDDLEASEATVRRDLELLSDQGLLVRTHGGAYSTSAQSTTHEPTIDQKRHLMVKEKRMIGREAASLVSPGETVILDTGSTTWHVGDALRSKSPLTVVSNDLEILTHLASFSGFKVIDTGGIIRPGLNLLLGPETVRIYKNVHVNWVFLGVDAVDLNQGITTTNLEEVPVKQAMIEAGRQVVVVVDHTKFGKTAFAHVCKLNEVFMIITDAGISPKLAEEAYLAGLNLKIVEYGSNEEIIGPE